jgi:hypothetical protein
VSIIDLEQEIALSSRFEQNIFRFQITVYQPRVLQYRQTIQQLLGKDFNKLSAESLKLILLDEFVEIR